MLRGREANRKKAHFLWMCALTAGAALAALLYYLPFERPHDLLRAQPLRTGWSYTTGEHPTPTDIAVLDHFIAFDPRDAMTLTRRMTEALPHAHLLLRLTYLRAQVFLGDTLLYENLDDPPGENPGSDMELIELPDDYAGQELRMVITTPYAAYAYSPDPIYIGDAGSLAALMQAHSARMLALLCIQVAGGIVLMCAALLGARTGGPGREWWANLCFGLFTVIYGLSQAAATDLFLASYPPRLGANVDLVAWYVFPIPLAFYLWLKSTAHRRWALALLALCGLASAPALLGALLGFWTLPETISVTNFAYIAMALLTGVLVALESIRGNKMFRYLTPGVALLLASAALALVRSGELYYVKEALREAGILLLMALVLADGLQSLMHIRRQKENDRQLMKIKTLLATEQLDTAEAYNQETRLLRHEMRHHLAAIRVLQREGKLPEIGEYVKSLLDGWEEHADAVVYCEHALVNATLNKTAADCKRWGIDFTSDASVPPELSLPDGDLCTLLLNMLENAVEAARQVAAGSRWVAVQVRVKDGFLVVSCRNARHTGGLRQHEGRFLSTKKNAGYHGFGILAMRQIAEKHHSKLNISFDEDSFSVKTVLQLDRA